MTPKLYPRVIAGYEMEILELRPGVVLVEIPIGEGKDREMFDKLVYYNQKVYHGKTADEVAKKVEEWIKNYKEVK